MASLIDQYSLEMTAKAKDCDALEAARNRIPAGTEISITFLAGEEHDARIAAAMAVRSAGMIPVPHISARRISSVEELDVFLDSLSRSAAVDRIFVVAGDADRPEGPYEDALAVIRSGRLARFGIRQVGIAGYPEGHPSIPQDRLWAALMDKQAALAGSGHSCEIVTQFSFDAEPILQWLAQLRKAKITAPVKIGIPGPASVKSLLRFAARCGVDVSSRVMAKYGLSLAKLLSPSGPDTLIEELEVNLDPLHGEVKLHVYPFGGLERTAEWALRFRLGRSNPRKSVAAEGLSAAGG